MGGEVRHSPGTDDRVNAPGREAVTDFSVEDIFATHRSLRIRLHLAAFTQQKLMRYKPAPLDTTPRISLSADTVMNIFSRHSEEMGRIHLGGEKRNFRRFTTSSDWCPVHGLVGASGAVLGSKSGSELAAEVLGQGLCATSGPEGGDTSGHESGLLERAWCKIAFLGSEGEQDLPATQCRSEGADMYGPQLIETWGTARRPLWWFAARAQDFSMCFPEMLPFADEIKERYARGCSQRFRFA